MGRWKMLTIAAVTAAMLAACSNGSSSAGTTEAQGTETQPTEKAEDTTAETDAPTEEQTTSAEESSTEESSAEETVAEGAVSAYPLRESGNLKSIELYEIAEEGTDTFNAWLKVATQFDPELTVYAADSLQQNTKALAVTFEVSNLDRDEVTLYWCYQLIVDGGTISVWDQSSPADTLNITEDGTYTMVFNVEQAAGGTLDSIESLQIVFPCDELTDTVVTFDKAQGITDEADLEYFTTGKTEK